MVQTIALAILIMLGGVAQYTLMAYALRDLWRRPRVRGDNKVIWGLAILCVPFAGALVYSWMGPTSFMQRRPPQTLSQPAASPASMASLPSTRRPVIAEGDFGRHVTPANVTSIRTARSLRTRSSAAHRTAVSHVRPPFEGNDPSPWRTGS
ncbi:MAG: PLD nuclease N-terminal domain-containing protein [Thermomicrobiales bacterium]